MKPRKPISKLGKSPVSKTKRRIQALLREYVILRDKKCVIGQALGTDCSGRVFQADHIFSRANSATFADLDNVILICQPHHGFWKPQHPVEYTEIIRKKLGEKKYKKLKAMSRTTLHLTKFDWELTEKSLKMALSKLKKATE